MNYLIGINSGGSKSDFIVTSDNLAKIYASTSRACNLKNAGIDNALELLDEILSAVISSVKVKPENIRGLCAGFAGAGRIHDTENLKLKFDELMMRKYGVQTTSIITTDAAITLEGALNGGEGIVLIAGTGSIIYAKDKKDIYYRSGGFGRIIGDEGSGYSIGRKGLAAAAKYFDSRAKENILAKYLSSEFNITTSECLIKKIYEENYEPSEFAPFVIKGAAENDSVCRKIIEEETDELILHIKAVKNFFENKFRLCFSGGLVTADNYFSQLLREKIAVRYPNIEIIEPQFPPETGAVLLLKKKLG